MPLNAVNNNIAGKAQARQNRTPPSRLEALSRAKARHTGGQTASGKSATDRTGPYHHHGRAWSTAWTTRLAVWLQKIVSR